jgi:protein-L-isoaspartate(D-aspartate) O-methyltransferase
MLRMGRAFRLAFSRTVAQNDAPDPRARGRSMVDFRAARRAMVDGQIRTNGVTNLDLIGAMLDVPREAFVPERQAALAYLDRDLPLPSGSGAPRYLIKPEVTAKLIQAADVMPQDRVLVVGTATGYSAAIVSRLAAAVVALEEDTGLAGMAQANLRHLGVANVTVVTGSLSAGWPAAAPYDVILVEGGVETVPEALFDELSMGGRLITVLYEGSGDAAGPIDGKVGKATLYRDVRDEVGGRALFDASAPLLPGFAKARAFVF